MSQQPKPKTNVQIKQDFSKKTEDFTVKLNTYLDKCERMPGAFFMFKKARQECSVARMALFDTMTQGFKDVLDDALPDESSESSVPASN